MSEPPVVPSPGQTDPSGNIPPAVPPPDPRYYPPFGQYPPYPPYAPYPPYPQPGYPPPGFIPPGYPVPGYPPPRRDNRRTVYGIIAAVLAVAIVLCIGCGLAVSTYINRLNQSLPGTLASLTVSEFCLDEEAQNYTSAYNLLSSNLQQQYPESQFSADGQQHDSTLGTITTCSQQGSVVSNTGNVKTVTIAVTRTATPTPDASGNVPVSQPTTYTGQVSLVDEAGQWKVDQVDSALDLL